MTMEEKSKETVEASETSTQAASNTEEKADSNEGFAKHFRKKEKQPANMVPKEEYDKMQDQYTKALSTAAYYENQCKYYKGEYDRSLKYRAQSVVEELLPILDGFQLAFKMEPPNKEAADYRVGFDFVYKMFKDVLTNEGVSAIAPKVGESYDPHKHQAVETIPTTDAKLEHTIAETLLYGYMLKDRLIRAATVKIYKLQEPKPVEKAEAKAAAQSTEDKEAGQTAKN